MTYYLTIYANTQVLNRHRNNVFDNIEEYLASFCTKVYEADNIHTEYEDTFSAKGFAINRLVGTIDKSLQPLETAEADADETDKTDEAEPADGNSEA